MSTSKWGHARRVSDETVKMWRETADTFPVTDVTSKSTLTGEAVEGLEVEIGLPDFTENVRAGMNLLDSVLPGWQESLDLTLLDLESDQQCVLGQTWPHYAKMHGLLEDGDYKQFADAVLSIGEEGERNTFAASIGCALSAEVFWYLNGVLYREIEKRWGIEPLAFRQMAGEGAAPSDPHFKAVAFFNETQDLHLRAMWEHLTRTWVTEINKAKEEGRWEKADEQVDALHL